MEKTFDLPKGYKVLDYTSYKGRHFVLAANKMGWVKTFVFLKVADKLPRFIIDIPY